MSKFNKRDSERKGIKKVELLDDKLIHENLDDLKGEGGEVLD
ncbi:hypothetical protein [Methanococcoides burtonii]|nr:hypothetical protein [Methanococcoides burtonii]